ncbi:glycosyltransferase family 2 protein [Marinilabilia salmonicolor]|uniref:glycosyltransferase family 2 protein n=1 Tax=Marinilabilia salmonicolor TaxID=989 RepID=UPI00029A5055|nr:glycosyltransferase [Marinilabilia salmonicolor]
MRESENAIPLVSVWMITYNHESYIAKAIEGVLMQKTNFLFQLVIGDDNSTDNTASIIRNFKLRYPKIIKAAHNNPNLGMIPNMIKTLEKCTGKYIAMCEGDDYWTDPNKLQKQVDFLESHPEYSGTAHQSLVKHENSDKAPSLFRNHNKIVIKLKDLFGDRLFHTASLMFRAEILKNNTLPTNITAGDRALFMLVAIFGKIHYSNEAMCCYRKNNTGISTWVTTELMEKDLNIVPWIKKIQPNFPKHQYYHFIHYTITRFPKTITKWKLIKHSFWYIYHSFFQFPKNIKQIIIFILYEFPKLWQKTKTI